MSDKSAAVVRQHEGLTLKAFGEEVTILLDGERTGGKLTMWRGITSPGGEPPPHYHSNEDETFHVLEGRVAFLVDGEWHEVSAGGAAFIHNARCRSHIQERWRSAVAHADHDDAVRIREILRALR